MPFLYLTSNTGCIILWLFNAVLRKGTNRSCESEHKTSLENQLTVQWNLHFCVPKSQCARYRLSAIQEKDNWLIDFYWQNLHPQIEIPA